MTSHARIVHVTVIFMRCCITCDKECWNSVALQSTQSELEGLWTITMCELVLRKNSKAGRGESLPATLGACRNMSNPGRWVVETKEMV